MFFWVAAAARAAAAAKEWSCVYPSVWAVPIPRDRVMDKELVSGVLRVASFGEQDSSRYLSVEQLKKDSKVWVSLKTGKWPHATGASQKVWLFGCDAAWRRAGRPCLEKSFGEVLEANPHVAQNLGLVADEHGLWGIGGETLKRKAYARNGSSNETTAVWWSSSLRSSGGISSNHSGCVELRKKYAPYCQYDGRFSIAKRDGEYWLYARANTNANGGGRYASAARLETAPTPGAALAWGRFRLIEFIFSRGGTQPYAEVLSDPLTAREKADIYTVAVSAYRGVFLGFFSTVVEHDGTLHAAILLAGSLDALRFSAPRALVRGIPAGDGELNDHVVDGLVREGRNLYFYVHHGVPGTFVKHHTQCAFLAQDARVKRLPRSHVVRYALNTTRLDEYLDLEVRRRRRRSFPPRQQQQELLFTKRTYWVVVVFWRNEKPAKKRRRRCLGVVGRRRSSAGVRPSSSRK